MQDRVGHGSIAGGAGSWVTMPIVTWGAVTWGAVTIGIVTHHPRHLKRRLGEPCPAPFGRFVKLGLPGASHFMGG
jgi:hypothetical protein